MFRKLYGETEYEQIKYLGKKLKTTALLAPLALLGIGLIIIFYMWGWDFVKRFFGITSILAILSRNIVSGVIIVIAFAFLGYLFGIINLVLGLCRFIFLKIKLKKQLEGEKL